VLRALDAGWYGPPFDPLALADLLQLQTVARADVRDARTVPAADGRGRIEFNPNRPRGRVRYSIAHEIAHTLFPDCAEAVRERVRHVDLSTDEWQLEALCNIAAAELLMPFGALPAHAQTIPSIAELVTLQREFDVSMEALAIRLTRLADAASAMFCAARLESGAHVGRYRLDYLIGSRTWKAPRLRGQLLPADTVLRECNAIGYTAAAEEQWAPPLPRLRVEGVGIPPYPGSRFPRVVGLVRLADAALQGSLLPGLRFVYGDATEPRGDGRRFIVHVVNDKTPIWGGGGFAQAVRSRWPSVQADFRDWVKHYPDQFRLGQVRIVDLTDGISVASVIAQHGYGPSPRPRLRYAALREGLGSVTTAARRASASLHMPRIGTGQAGGLWHIVEDLVRATCCDSGLEVTVYDLPGTLPATVPAQGDLLAGG
jgi:hypothetical protein